MSFLLFEEWNTLRTRMVENWDKMEEIVKRVKKLVNI